MTYYEFPKSFGIFSLNLCLVRVEKSPPFEWNYSQNAFKLLEVLVIDLNSFLRTKQ